MACLVIVDGPATGTHFALGSHKVVDVGRDEECTLQVIDPLVSRHHLQIRAVHDGRHVAADCGSVNGVLVNSVRIVGEALLNSGDEITIGTSRIIYTTADYPDAQRAMMGVRPGRQWTSPTVIRK